MKNRFLVLLFIAAVTAFQIYAYEPGVVFGTHVNERGVQTFLSEDQNSVIAKKAFESSHKPVEVAIALDDDESVATAGSITHISGASDTNIVKSVNSLLPVAQKLTPEENAKLLQAVPKVGQSWDRFNGALDTILSARGQRLNHQEFVQKLHAAESGNLPEVALQKGAAKKVVVDAAAQDEEVKLSDDSFGATVETIPVDQIKQAFSIKRLVLSQDSSEIYSGIQKVRTIADLPKLMKQANGVLTPKLLHDNPIGYVQIVAELLHVEPDFKSIQEKVKQLLNATETPELMNQNIVLLNDVMKNLGMSSVLLVKDAAKGSAAFKNLQKFTDLLQDISEPLFEDESVKEAILAKQHSESSAPKKSEKSPDIQANSGFESVVQETQKEKAGFADSSHEHARAESAMGFTTEQLKDALASLGFDATDLDEESLPTQEKLKDSYIKLFRSSTTEIMKKELNDAYEKAKRYLDLVDETQAEEALNPSDEEIARVSKNPDLGSFKKIADAYESLNLKPGATANQIEAAYRKLALKLHPDKEGGDTELFQKITVAHDIINMYHGLKD